MAPAAQQCAGQTCEPPRGGLDFDLPESLVAHEPPEARGLARDEVRLMVSAPDDNAIAHTRFHQLPEFIRAGDVLVVNQSATINAAVHAWRGPLVGQGKEPVELHVSSPDPAGGEERWVVEVRRVTPQGTAPLLSLLLTSPVSRGPSAARRSSTPRLRAAARAAPSLALR